MRDSKCHNPLVPPLSAHMHHRGSQRGGGSRGGGSGYRGGSRSGGSSSQQVLTGLTPPSHITTIGVRRPGYGVGGREFPILVNSFRTAIPEGIIHHYDVVISPSEKNLPARMNLDIIQCLQTVVAPNIFTPRCVYDGRKNIFAIRELPFGDSPSCEFDVPLQGGRASHRAPKIYKVRLTKVAEINPEVLNRYVRGEQSHDNSVLTAITALNVVIRMEPTMNYPFNVRSFFTDRETKDIGSGIHLWRGYFQSIRPGINQMFINIDISTATMYQSGSLLRVCVSYLKKDHPMQLFRQNLPERELIRLQRFVAGMRIVTNYPVGGPASGGRGDNTPRVIKRLSRLSAREDFFSLREGGRMSVADYFRQTMNRPLNFPDLVCVEVGTGAKIPLELCEIPPGQIIRKQIPSEKTRDILEFATKRPNDRLASIRNGLSVLAYGQSDYVRHFGMHVDVASGPVRVQARVLKAPLLRFGENGKIPTTYPTNGAWNMFDKKFYRPAPPIVNWGLVCFETQNRLSHTSLQEIMGHLSKACRLLGIQMDPTPYVRYASPQSKIRDSLRSLGREIYDQTKRPPALFVVILPEGGNEIYTEVKHFGDIEMGCPTQCMKSSKCHRAKAQYFANVCLKMNVKLGGVNLIPDPSSASMSILTDPMMPTIIMGADVIHPAPGAIGRPSFTSLVGNVDAESAKYVAESRVQASKQEMIADLCPMTKEILSLYMRYRRYMENRVGNACHPKRMIFYRDGVSEGQFKQVLDLELPLIKRACQELEINDIKITIIVVGKRHHVRFFPALPGDADKTGNCQAGTVVDREIVHPTDFDFYLQSHGAILGTSRPAHYSVLYDENGFTPDAIQSLSYALCHVYARSTRSVSIPAPVYYADIVCSRARNHFDPSEQWDVLGSEDTGSGSSGDQPMYDALEVFQKGFKPLHKNQKTLMYFS